MLFRNESSPKGYRHTFRNSNQIPKWSGCSARSKLAAVISRGQNMQLNRAIAVSVMIVIVFAFLAGYVAGQRQVPTLPSGNRRNCCVRSI